MSVNALSSEFLPCITVEPWPSTSSKTYRCKNQLLPKYLLCATKFPAALSRCWGYWRRYFQFPRPTDDFLPSDDSIHLNDLFHSVSVDVDQSSKRPDQIPRNPCSKRGLLGLDLPRETERPVAKATTTTLVRTSNIKVESLLFVSCSNDLPNPASSFHLQISTVGALLEVSPGKEWGYWRVPCPFAQSITTMHFRFRHHTTSPSTYNVIGFTKFPFSVLDDRFPFIYKRERK